MIRHAIETANTEILDQVAEEMKNLRGMGTTMVVCHHRGTLCLCGKCRRQQTVCGTGCRFSQVTKDHSLVQEMVRMGEIKPEEARNHPDKNIITRALGAEQHRRY